MEPAETYKGWMIQSQKVFYVEAWDTNGNYHIAVKNAKTEEEALELAKKWIDRYNSRVSSVFPNDLLVGGMGHSGDFVVSSCGLDLTFLEDAESLET